MAVNAKYGTRIKRREDPTLIQGKGTYTDDVSLPGMLHAAFVRAGVAHGKITNVDTSAAKESPGVVAVYTAEDLGLNDLPNAGPPVPSPETMRRPILASDKVRFIGEAIAVVVAETRAQAVDAVDMVEVDVDELPVLVDMTKALEDDAPILFEEAGTNLAAGAPLGAEGALDDADVVMTARYVNQRVAAVPMEPAAAVAAPDPDTGGVRLWAPLQSPHSGQAAVMGSLDLEKEKVRVTVPVVGGGFGARIATYPEQIVLAAVALKLDKPVRYVESRWETMLAMQHGRAQVQDVELGAKNDGTITGIRLRVIADCGAYPADATLMPLLTGLMASGVYSIPKVDFAFQAVVTNTTPIGAYRGAGRPEATALLERAMDQLAKKLDMDPAEIRRKNFIPPESFPLTTVAGASYDSGEYEKALDKVLENSGYHELRKQQAERRASGDPKQLGIGLATYVELTGMGSEIGTCIIDEDGKVTVSSGTSPQGQGHDTMFAAIVSDVLGVPMDDVIVVHSDTAKVPRGMGTMGSRSLQVGGSAVFNATNTVLDKGKQIAASMLEASAEDIDVVPNKGLGVKGSPDATVSWADLAKASVDLANLPEGFEPGLAAETDFATPDSSYPFGAHVSLVEVDTETGLTTLLRHITVDDSGRILNPLLAEGQRHGGLAQGVAQALLEEVLYDDEGNPLTSTLADYPFVSATELPSFELVAMETPTPINPLGAKGVGESGTIGSTPAVQSAVVDAVAHLGVRHIDMPTTPMRVWTAVRAASKRGA
ncbi:MAG: aerobic carbon-monoxide dehydrogenase large subunit [Solirubrobacteraceae bacterium]|nr:aerobic carbon-monoxide dehydrogenase large subunit [Solirubrobacteraceae bacterium]